MNAPSPFAPRAYLDRKDLAALLKVKPRWLVNHSEELEAIGFPKPAPWHTGKRLYDPLAIALWQDSQLHEDYQAALARLLAIGQAQLEFELKSEADLSRVRKKIAHLPRT